MVAGIMASGNGTVSRESRLLSRDENEQVVRMLGARCESLATSVVQLFVTEGPDHGSWIKRDAGVLCLVKDHFKRSYFLRLYCLMQRALVWEHEVYNSMEYNAPKTFLHTFEGQDGIVAFNFANEEDARVLHNTLLQKLDRKKRHLERKSRSSYTSSRHSSTPPHMPPPAASMVNGSSRPPPYQPQPRSTAAITFPVSSGKGKDKGGKKTITKADIGMPLDFRHVSHVGWDPNKGFDVDNVEDPQLKHFFVKAGVSDSQLQDRETREFIYDFINQHGGLDAVKEEELFQPPPVPARASPAPSGRVAPPPPPPPSRTAAPPLPAAPPSAAPPPPVRTMPQRGHPAQDYHHGNAGFAAPPPPPPPPPPPALTSAPDAPPPRDAPREAPDSHSALMDAIKSGKALKRADAESSRRPPSDGDPRDDLLRQIQLGTQLKPVQHVPKPAGLPSDGLAGALAKALAERNRAYHSDSESEASSMEADDEWDD